MDHPLLRLSRKPAPRLKTLELLGKITEVALFTERREVVQVTDSEAMRAKLLQSLRLAMDNSGAIDAEYTSADDLLNEIAGTASDPDALNDPASQHEAQPASEASETQGGEA